MSIYFIRHAGLVKIGYSSDLRKRIAAIISGIPSPDVTFIGHMPGDREVEAHLHSVFEKHRFSGEWFFFAPPIVQFSMSILLRELPAAAVTLPKGEGRLLSGEPARVSVATALRQFASRQWPDHTHNQRKIELAKVLGVTGRRAKSLYEAEPHYTLKVFERDAIDALGRGYLAAAQQTETNTEQGDDDV